VESKPQESATDKGDKEDENRGKKEGLVQKEGVNAGEKQALIDIG